MGSILRSRVVTSFATVWSHIPLLGSDLDFSITSDGCHLNVKGYVHAEDVIAQLHRLLHDGNLTPAYALVLQVSYRDDAHKGRHRSP